MKCIIIGLGIQGKKRVTIAGTEVVGTVDPIHPEATFLRIQDVPLESFDTALVCTPDAAKLEILSYLLRNGKHVLVEKPLAAPSTFHLEELQKLANQHKVVCYTAYNHRFEPHIVELR